MNLAQELPAPSHIAVTETYSEISARRLARKKARLARKQAKKALRLTKKTSRQNRRADRKARRVERKRLRREGKALSVDDLADEELDMEEAYSDADYDEAEELSGEARDSGDYDGEGLPTWAKWTIGITVGLGVIGLATWAIMRMGKKK